MTAARAKVTYEQVHEEIMKEVVSVRRHLGQHRPDGEM